MKSIFTRSKELEIELGRLQNFELTLGHLEESDRLKLESVAAALSSLALQKECFWRQRSRIGWLAYGDSNTSFFHRSASARRKENKISAA